VHANDMNVCDQQVLQFHSRLKQKLKPIELDAAYYAKEFQIDGWSHFSNQVKYHWSPSISTKLTNAIQAQIVTA
jgi:hypothetical protein